MFSNPEAQMSRSNKALPCTSLGWYRYYAKRYEETGSEDAMYLAQLNLTFYLAFGEEVQAA